MPRWFGTRGGDTAGGAPVRGDPYQGVERLVGYSFHLGRSWRGQLGGNSVDHFLFSWVNFSGVSVHDQPPRSSHVLGNLCGSNTAMGGWGARSMARPEGTSP